MATDTNADSAKLPGFDGASPLAAPRRPRLDHLVSLNRIAAEPLHWLSPGRIAAGKITILDGDPGLGKSTLLCELAARVSRGDPLPGGQPAPPRYVVLMSAEDDLYDTIRPRIDAAGGDAARIFSFANLPQPGVAPQPVAIPDHLDFLEEILDHTHAALLVIDPLIAFLSRRHSANSEQAVRRALTALKGLAERTGTAIVAVRHLNKSLTANPLYRGGGSIGIIGAARCGLLLAPDPELPERRILAATKGNLGPPPPSLAFRLVAAPGNTIARVVWDGETAWSADRLLQDAAVRPEARSVIATAREWLLAVLADGPRPGKDLLAEAAHAGIGRNALYAARKSEGISIRKEPIPGGRWVWTLPDAHSELPHPSDPREVREVR